MAILTKGTGKRRTRKKAKPKVSHDCPLCSQPCGCGGETNLDTHSTPPRIYRNHSEADRRFLFKLGTDRCCHKCSAGYGEKHSLYQ